ncbi:MAG: hypothetical protein CME71_06365 [Halobacteriovorax sp.]|nr:hypothetical protein [Halobacteriovorax sp.]
MAMGKTHDGFNLFIGAVLTGGLIGYQHSLIVWLPFIFGWLFSTLVFSPDTDLMPKKRTGILQFFLYPYSILFKHRGLSHGLITGTLTRITYSVLLGGLLVFVLSKMGYIDFAAEGYWSGLVEFVREYDYDKTVYKSLSWLYIGMALADACHIFLDWLSGVFSKIRRNY